ncbi:hypothetical protein OIO90_006109 [Microbotryomycetes sp. JL221]|nr:hypothetical protein OIO90_006109 [Microbotryomycetes sp. JL221]
MSAGDDGETSKRDEAISLRHTKWFGSDRDIERLLKLSKQQASSAEKLVMSTTDNTSSNGPSFGPCEHSKGAFCSTEDVIMASLPSPSEDSRLIKSWAPTESPMPQDTRDWVPRVISPELVCPVTASVTSPAADNDEHTQRRQRCLSPELGLTPIVQAKHRLQALLNPLPTPPPSESGEDDGQVWYSDRSKRRRILAEAPAASQGDSFTIDHETGTLVKKNLSQASPVTPLASKQPPRHAVYDNLPRSAGTVDVSTRGKKVQRVKPAPAGNKKRPTVDQTFARDAWVEPDRNVQMKKGKPPIWSIGRQELCESLPYFKSYQGGHYDFNERCFGYLLDGFGAANDVCTAGGRIIISHGGGCSEGNRDDYRLKGNQTKDNVRMRALYNCKERQTPVALIAGSNWKHFAGLKDLKARYAVLGYYFVRDIWVEAESAGDDTDKFFTRFKILFEWAPSQGVPWFEHLLVESANVLSHVREMVSKSLQQHPVPERRMHEIFQELDADVKEASELKTTNERAAPSVHEDLQVESVSRGRWKGWTIKLGDDAKIHQLWSEDAGDKTRANDLFKAYQSEESSRLFKRSLLHTHKLPGAALCSQFSFNTGEKYHFGVTTDTVSFDRPLEQASNDEARSDNARALTGTTATAPACVRRACQSISQVARGVCDDVESDDIIFNEVLSVAYMEGGKMSYHDDGEVGLGPVVASLSLGSDATMDFRRKPPKKDRRSHVASDAAQRDYVDQDAEGKDSQVAESKQSRKSKSVIVVRLTLKHGDFLIMEGRGVQRDFDHMVRPVNLRYAATARFIGQDHRSLSRRTHFEVSDPFASPSLTKPLTRTKKRVKFNNTSNQPLARSSKKNITKSDTQRVQSDVNVATRSTLAPGTNATGIIFKRVPATTPSQSNSTLARDLVRLPPVVTPIRSWRDTVCMSSPASTNDAKLVDFWTPTQAPRGHNGFSFVDATASKSAMTPKTVASPIATTCAQVVSRTTGPAVVAPTRPYQSAGSIPSQPAMTMCANLSAVRSGSVRAQSSSQLVNARQVVSHCQVKAFVPRSVTTKHKVKSQRMDPTPFLTSVRTHIRYDQLERPILAMEPTTYKIPTSCSPSIRSVMIHDAKSVHVTTPTLPRSSWKYVAPICVAPSNVPLPPGPPPPGPPSRSGFTKRNWKQVTSNPIPSLALSKEDVGSHHEGLGGWKQSTSIGTPFSVSPVPPVGKMYMRDLSR